MHTIPFHRSRFRYVKHFFADRHRHGRRYGTPSFPLKTVFQCVVDLIGVFGREHVSYVLYMMSTFSTLIRLQTTLAVYPVFDLYPDPEFADQCPGVGLMQPSVSTRFTHHRLVRLSSVSPKIWTSRCWLFISTLRDLCPLLMHLYSRSVSAKTALKFLNFVSPVLLVPTVSAQCGLYARNVAQSKWSTRNLFFDIYKKSRHWDNFRHFPLTNSRYLNYRHPEQVSSRDFDFFRLPMYFYSLLSCNCVILQVLLRPNYLIKTPRLRLVIHRLPTFNSL